MAKPAILFDFDGTLADTLDAVVEIANRLAEEFGYEPVSRAKLEELKRLDGREVLRRSQVPLLKIPSLIRRLRSELYRELPHLNPIPGIESALQKLHAEGHVLGVLTSNSQENVTAFLDARELSSYFSFVHSGLTLFGKGRIMRRLLSRYELSPRCTIYVGDETRDIDAARFARTSSVAVSWGFNARELLAQSAPDRLIDRPEELPQAIASILGRY
ncbi:MAG: HAD hydrolase-like protein [Cyanobacteria bacterium P01_D01_bin.123]